MTWWMVDDAWCGTDLKPREGNCQAAAIAAAPTFHRALADPMLLTPLAHAARALEYTLSVRSRR